MDNHENTKGKAVITIIVVALMLVAGMYITTSPRHITTGKLAIESIGELSNETKVAIFGITMSLMASLLIISKNYVFAILYSMPTVAAAVHVGGVKGIFMICLPIGTAVVGYMRNKSKQWGDVEDE